MTDADGSFDDHAGHECRVGFAALTSAHSPVAKRLFTLASKAVLLANDRPDAIGNTPSLLRLKVQKEISCRLTRQFVPRQILFGPPDDLRLKRNRGH